MTYTPDRGSMERFDTGTGQLVWVHPKAKCEGEYCCIHNPSDHPMKDYPLHWRSDKGSMERICPHGIGHPDPDEMAFLKRIGSYEDHMGVHGCDGCCTGNHPTNSQNKSI